MKLRVQLALAFLLLALTTAGEQWSAGAPLHDDVTLVVVKVR